ncbi:uncharacterized protein BP5553_03770 [Venustampulla echinocandica]|uniref:Translation initiation factor 3 N-terminal domain-containing protein n=1 Tax=Venustampulla echinocandica TaxID=2656787 RepID=A0A370TV98_9HELO|nr:uncharacterized protein BP5553_03770 [Venustampulla echinocandica]RDL39430.1 hypothetical protein BP5553_03770 [Venustampulla echinocandica]
MQSSKCIFSTAAALQRTFITPFEQRQLQFVFQSSRASSLCRQAPRLLSPLARQQQKRYYYVAGTNPVKSRLPQNDEIKAFSVHLVNEDGTLGELHRTRFLLDRLVKGEALIMVAEAEAGRPPVCKIINRKEQAAADREKKKKAQATKDPSSTVKNIELNWAIESNDLGHRMDRLKEFLGKGYKVDLLLQKKRKGRPTTMEEAQELVNTVKQTVEDAGGREYKEMTGDLLRQVMLFTVGKVQK